VKENRTFRERLQLYPPLITDRLWKTQIEAVFQLMMLAYNLFLLFKMDFAGETEYRQQIKTFRLKYIFLVGKITLHV